VKLSALGTGLALLPQICSVSGIHFCYKLSKPFGLLRLEGLGKLEKSIHVIANQSRDPSRLNHCATACLLVNCGQRICETLEANRHF
jgi:hypothetical protein